MKITTSPLLLWACLLLQFSAAAQMKLTLTAKGLTGEFIWVEKPLDGKYFPLLEQVEKSKKGRFDIESDATKSGFFILHFDGEKQVRVFLEPGDHLGITVDVTDVEKSLLFFGDHVEQNKFLNELPRLPMTMNGLDTGDSVLAENVSPKELFTYMSDLVEAELRVMKKEAKKKFSKAFLAAMEQDIFCYHALHFSSIAAWEFAKLKAEQPSQFNEKWAEYWGKAFTHLDLNEAKLAVSPYYVQLLDQYIGDYKLGYSQENEFLEPDLVAGEQFLEYDRLLWKYLKDEALEYGVAAVFSLEIQRDASRPALSDLFQKYGNDFPEGRFKAAYQLAAEKVQAFQQEKEYDMPAGATRLDADAEINNLKDLLKMFRGKVVYLDVWATWCGPCLLEMRHSEQLEKFAKDKDLALVFVSVDDSDRMDKWKTVIEENNLNGNHVLATYALRDDLIQHFGEGGTLSLPHYLIYDKNGKLVDEDATRPSQYTVLFKELSKYIEN